jgi:hypothetical protein
VSSRLETQEEGKYQKFLVGDSGEEPASEDTDEAFGGGLCQRFRFESQEGIQCQNIKVGVSGGEPMSGDPGKILRRGAMSANDC